MNKVVVSGKGIDGVSALLVIDYDGAFISNPRILQGEQELSIPAQDGVIIYSEDEALPRYYFWTGEKLVRYSVSEQSGNGGLWEPLNVALLSQEIIYFGGQYSMVMEKIGILANSEVYPGEDPALYAEKAVVDKVVEEISLFSQELVKKIKEARREVNKSTTKASETQIDMLEYLKNKYPYKPRNESNELTVFQKKILDIQLKDYFLEEKKEVYAQLLVSILNLNLSFLRKEKSDTEEISEVKETVFGLVNYIIPKKVNAIKFRETQKPMIAEVINYCRWVIAIEIALSRGVFPEEYFNYDEEKVFPQAIRGRRIGESLEEKSFSERLLLQEQNVSNQLCLMSEKMYSVDILSDKDLDFLEQVHCVLKSIVTREVRPEHRDILDEFFIFSINTPEKKIQEIFSSKEVHLGNIIELIKKTLEKLSIESNEEDIELNREELLFVLNNIPKEKLIPLLKRIKVDSYITGMFECQESAKRIYKKISENFDENPEAIFFKIAMEKNFSAKKLGCVFAGFTLDAKWLKILAEHQASIEKILSESDMVVQLLSSMSGYEQKITFLKWIDKRKIVKNSDDFLKICNSIVISEKSSMEIYGLFLPRLLEVVEDDDDKIKEALASFLCEDKTIYIKDFKMRKFFEAQKKYIQPWNSEKSVSENIEEIFKELYKNGMFDKNAIKSIVDSLPKSTDSLGVLNYLEKVNVSISKIHSHEKNITLTKLVVEYCIEKIPLSIKVVDVVKRKLPNFIDSIEAYLHAIKSTKNPVYRSITYSNNILRNAKSLQLARELEKEGGINEVLLFLETVIEDGTDASCFLIGKMLFELLGGVHYWKKPSHDEPVVDTLERLVEILKTEIGRELNLGEQQGTRSRKLLSV